MIYINKNMHGEIVYCVALIKGDLRILRTDWVAANVSPTPALSYPIPSVLGSQILAEHTVHPE